MADGGDGTVELFVESGARACTVKVHDPLGRVVDARFALDDTRAVIELASASGLVMLRGDERDPWRTDTRGTGELLLAALDAGVREIVIGIGGSATNDAGVGILRALGARTDPPDALHGIRSIDLSGIDARIARVKLTVASDVDNPLCGPNGASAVFGPQKGVRPDDVAKLDEALAKTADAVAKALGKDLRDVPGAGAAGGAGFALLVLGGQLRPGVEVVAELIGLPKALDGASLCLTGEGAIDMQTLHGKTLWGVARYAKAANVPTIAFGGSVDANAEDALGRAGVTCIPIVPRAMSLDEAMRETEPLLTAAASRAARLLLL